MLINAKYIHKARQIVIHNPAHCVLKLQPPSMKNNSSNTVCKAVLPPLSGQVAGYYTVEYCTRNCNKIGINCYDSSYKVQQWH